MIQCWLFQARHQNDLKFLIGLHDTRVSFTRHVSGANILIHEDFKETGLVLQWPPADQQAVHVVRGARTGDATQLVDVAVIHAQRVVPAARRELEAPFKHLGAVGKETWPEAARAEAVPTLADRVLFHAVILGQDRGGTKLNIGQQVVSQNMYNFFPKNMSGRMLRRDQVSYHAHISLASVRLKLLGGG